MQFFNIYIRIFTSRILVDKYTNLSVRLEPVSGAKFVAENWLTSDPFAALVPVC